MLLRHALIISLPARRSDPSVFQSSPAHLNVPGCISQWKTPVDDKTTKLQTPTMLEIYTIIQKFGVCKINNILLLSKDALNWSKVSVKTCIMFFWTFWLHDVEVFINYDGTNGNSKNPEIIFPPKYEARLFPTLIIIIIINVLSSKSAY